MDFDLTRETENQEITPICTLWQRVSQSGRDGFAEVPATAFNGWVGAFVRFVQALGSPTRDVEAHRAR